MNRTKIVMTTALAKAIELADAAEQGTVVQTRPGYYLTPRDLSGLAVAWATIASALAEGGYDTVELFLDEEEVDS